MNMHICAKNCFVNEIRVTLEEKNTAFMTGTIFSPSKLFFKPMIDLLSTLKARGYIYASSDVIKTPISEISILLVGSSY